MIRIEAGLIFAGYEFDDQVDPFEAGIGFTVKLDTEDDFVGKEALSSARPTRSARSSGLELEGNETAGHGDEVYVGPPPGRRGHERHAQPDPAQEHRALPDGRAVRASSAPRSRSASSTGSRSASPRQVVRVPFYDPDKTRPRS